MASKRGKIDEMYDFSAMEEQHKKVMGMIAQFVETANGVKPIAVKLEGSEKTKDVIDGIKQVGAATTSMVTITNKAINEYGQLITISQKVNGSYEQTRSILEKYTGTLDQNMKLHAKYKVQLEDIARSIKEQKKAYDQGLISQDQYQGKLAELTQRQTELKVASGELMQTIKSQVKEQQAAAGSYDEMNAVLGRSRDLLRQLSEEEKNSPFGQLLAKQVDELDQKLKEEDAKMGNHFRKVGDYQGAFSAAFETLRQELEQVRNDLNSGAFKGEALAALQRQEALLSEITEGLGREFTSTRGEARAFQEAAAKLGISLGQDSKAFQAFRKEVGEGVDAIADVKDSIKLAASDTRGLDRLISAAQGLTGAFSVAQGAAALFGDENEDLQKTFVKLQAAMTILSGLQGIQAELTNKDSIFRKIAVTAQELWNKAISRTTVATEAEAAAHAQNTAAIEAENAAKAAGAAISVADSGAAAAEELQAVAQVVDAKEALVDTEKALAAAEGVQAVAAQASTAATTEQAVASEGATVAENASTASKQKGVVATILHTTWTKISAVANKIWAATALESAAATIALRAALTGGLILLLPALAFAFSRLADANEKYNQKAKELEERQKALKEINEKAADAVAKVKVQIEDMRSKIQLAKEGVLKKSEVLKEYNETLGKSMGKVNSLGAAEKELIEKAEKFIEYTWLKAQAEAAYGLAVEETATQMKARAGDIGDFVTTAQGAEKSIGATLKGLLWGSGSAASTIVSTSTALIKEGSKNQEDAITKSKTREEFFMKQRETFLKKMEELKKKYGFTDPTKDPANTPRDSKESDAAEKQAAARRKAEFEIQKQRLSDSIAYADQIAQSEKASFNQRLEAEQGYYNFKKELLDQSKQYELNEIDIAAAEEKKKIIERLKNDKNLTGPQRQAYQQALIEIDKTAAAQKLAIEAKYNSDVLALNQDSEQRITALVQDNTEKRKANKEKAVQDNIDTLQRQLEDELNVIQDRAAEETRILTEQYNNGTISKEQYEKGLLKIEADARRESLLAEIKYYEKLIQMSNLPEDKKREALLKLKALKREILQGEVKDEQEAADKVAEIHKKKNEKLKELGEELKGLAFDLLTGSIEQEKNQVQDQIDKLEEKKQKEIEVVNQTIANEQEKADKIAVIEARANAEKERLERRKRQLDQERARYERLRNIADIIQSTAIAVVSALGSKPWGPQNIALAAIVGAIGAAQVARVLATPIPKYKEGTENHPGGLAITGDGGVSEYVVTPEGEITRTPSVPTLMDLPKGTRVYKDDNAFMDALLGQQLQAAYGVSAGPAPAAVPWQLMESSMDRRFSSLEKTIKGMPQPVIEAVHPVKRYVHGSGTQTKL